MSKQAKIELRSRNVKGTLGIFQHLFIIHINSQDQKTILRGGPSSGNEFLGNIEVIKARYEIDDKGRKPIDWDVNALRSELVEGPELEIQNLVDVMWERAQVINEQRYDYKFPIGKYSQNSNTVVKELLIAADLEMKLPLDEEGNEIIVPGIHADLAHTEFDDFMLENICDFMGGDCRKYRKEVEELFEKRKVQDSYDTFSEGNNQWTHGFQGLQEQSNMIQRMFDVWDETHVLEDDITNRERFVRLTQYESVRGNREMAEIYKNMANAQGDVERFFDSFPTLGISDDDDEFRI